MVSDSVRPGIPTSVLIACAVCLPGIPPLIAQEVIEVPAEDRWLDADFEALYRVGSVDDGWDAFGQVAAVDFDGAGNLHILDSQAARITVVDLAGDLVAFAPEFKVGVLPDGGVAFTDSSTYRIKITEPNGRVSRVLTRPLRPEPVTRQHRAEYLERAAESIRRRAESEPMEFHHEIPVVLDLRTSREGTIWVLRRGDEPDSDGPIDLIAADGRYLGTFIRDATDLPSAFGPDGLVAFVERDDLDVQTVVVRRLPPGVR